MQYWEGFCITHTPIHAIYLSQLETFDCLYLYFQGESPAATTDQLPARQTYLRKNGIVFLSYTYICSWICFCKLNYTVVGGDIKIKWAQCDHTPLSPNTCTTGENVASPSIDYRRLKVNMMPLVARRLPPLEGDHDTISRQTTTAAWRWSWCHLSPDDYHHLKVSMIPLVFRRLPPLEV